MGWRGSGTVLSMEQFVSAISASHDRETCSAPATWEVGSDADISRLNPRMYRMIWDILRFNLFALDILSQGSGRMSIGEYLDKEGYGDGFKEDYLLVSFLHLSIEAS